MKIANSIFAAFVLLFLTPGAHALDPSQPVSSYIRTQFTSDNNGLPSDIVRSIVQSRDGFLWLTFGNGALARFDGRQFTPLPVTRVGGVTLGPDGDLWFGMGSDLVQIPAAALNQFGPLQAIRHPTALGPNIQIVALHFSPNGILWVGATSGLYRYDQGVLSPVIPQLDIQRIEDSSNGNLLITSSQGLTVWDGSRAVADAELATKLGVKAQEIFHVFEDSRGVTWICTSMGVARRVGNSIEKLQPWGPKNEYFKIYEDPQANIWIAGSAGLFRATNNVLEQLIAKIKVRELYSDRDGNLWVGTNGDGLFRFKDRAVRMFTQADGLPGNTPMAVLTSHDGTLWAGFNCGGIAHFDGHSFRTYNEKDGLLNSCVFTLAEDANHDLWVGTYNGGAFRFHDGKFTPELQGSIHAIIDAIVPARDGSLWFVKPNGLTRLRNGQIRNYTTVDGLSSNQTLGLYEDRQSDIWVGTMSGIDRLDGDRFLKVANIPDDAFWLVGEDYSGALYVNRAGSVYRLAGSNLIPALPNIDQIHLIKTADGDLWFDGVSILRVPRAFLEQSHAHDEPVVYEEFGVLDGMSAAQSTNGYPGSALTPDGKLWVATVQGLAMIDLPHVSRTDRKPEIYMKEFVVGRNQQLPGQQLVLPPGTSHIELKFDAIEIMSPEKIRMQYRMDGVDSEWLDADLPGHAVYSTIPPGTHAFRIRACNRHGIWDRTGMVYLIVQKPFFYQTTWFRVAVIATALLLVFALYRLRLRQATARLNASFDERLAERTRIARELHDTLLQTVQGSKLVADNALKKPDDVVHLLGAMKRLAGWLGQATQEGRAALNSLRTSTVETNDLATALRRATEECRVNDSLEVKFSVTGGPRETHPIARDEIYRIAYEAIRNACEHSSATTLEVSLHYAQDLTLRVKDNGIGIESAVVAEGRAGHFGLRGMRERAERIGSKLTIVSSPNAGTEVTLIVPGGVILQKTPV